MDEQTRETLGGIALAATLVVACVGWYVGWVQPREELLLAVADCTEDSSQEEWDRCVEVVRGESQ